MNRYDNTSNQPFILHDDLSADPLVESVEPFRQQKPARLRSRFSEPVPYTGPNLITLQMYAKCPVLKIT